MPIHGLDDVPDAATQADVIVVGAGAVGIAMAVRLARAGRRVTLIERGPAEPDAGYRTRNHGPADDGSGSGRRFDGLREGRMQALGGTTRLWGGQLIPFDAGDLDARDADGRRLWPIDHAEFARSVAAAYAFLGIDAAGRDTAGLWRRATGGALDPGHGIAFHMNIWLPQPDFRRLFAADLERRANLCVVTDAPVQRLRFAADGTVVGIVAGQAEDGEGRLFTARHYVLAAGTIENARLLLAAAASAPVCPFAGNRHLGRWFMDHLHGLVGTIEDPDVVRLGRLFDNVYVGGRKYSVKIRREAGSSGLANVAATLNPRTSAAGLARDARDLVRRLLRGSGNPWLAAARGLALARIVLPLAWRYLVQRRSTSLFAGGIALGIELEQMPNADSYVFLDPHAPPEHARAGVHWALRGGEIDAVADIALRLEGWFAQAGLGRVVLDPRVAARDPALLDDFHDVYHHMGGARMADSAEHGVVDRDCRVFGAANLTIGGAAVFPSGSFANPTLSAIALGLRAADRIAAEVGSAIRVDDGDAPSLVGRLVFGCARLPGGVSQRQGLRLIDLALAAGVSAIDTAPSYGMGLAEAVVGKALVRARAAGLEVRVIAKVGSLRPGQPLLRSGLRAARRLIRQPPPRSQHDFAPVAPCERFGRGDFSPASLERSVASTRAALDTIDDLLLHDCAPGEFGPVQRATLEALARAAGARPGYALSSYLDPATDARYPAGYVAECAIAPTMLTGEWRGPIPDAPILHSIVPTGAWLARTDPAFAAALDRAAALVANASDLADHPATSGAARIAALYALASARVPTARLVFASAAEHRLAALLAAFAAIDRDALIAPIAECFGSPDGLALICRPAHRLPRSALPPTSGLA